MSHRMFVFRYTMHGMGNQPLIMQHPTLRPTATRWHVHYSLSLINWVGKSNVSS